MREEDEDEEEDKMRRGMCQSPLVRSSACLLTRSPSSTPSFASGSSISTHVFNALLVFNDVSQTVQSFPSGV